MELAVGDFDLTDAEASGSGSEGLEEWLKLVLSGWGNRLQAELVGKLQDLAKEEVKAAQENLKSAPPGDLGKYQYLEGQINAWETLIQKLEQIRQARFSAAISADLKIEGRGKS